MPESLNDFRRRTAFVWDSLPKEGSFATNPRLAEKVGPDGKLLPFFGDTVIFDLDDAAKDWLRGMQRELYDACGGMMAEALDPASFHITLHDLNSAPNHADVAEAMDRARPASEALLAELEGKPWREICVRSTAAFSMVNTSVVLGFEPAGEADCAALMELYERFQEIVPLGYPLTPHVTLGYYRPGDYGPEGLQMLRSALAKCSRAEPRTLRLPRPVYARFADMNRYFFGEELL